MSSKQQKSSIKKLTQFSILLAIELILGFTPLGLITLPVASITILHIPVIIAAISLGVQQGALMGLAFGLISLTKATFSATTLVDTLFSPFLSGNPVASIIMCIVPRVLLGVFAALLFAFFKKIFKKPIWAIGLSAALATALHTIMVLGCLFSFFGTISFQEIFATLISFNGILEIIAAVIICTPVCNALLKYLPTKK